MRSGYYFMESRLLFKVWGDLGLGIGLKRKVGFGTLFFLRKALGKRLRFSLGTSSMINKSGKNGFSIWASFRINLKTDGNPTLLGKGPINSQSIESKNNSKQDFNFLGSTPKLVEYIFYSNLKHKWINLQKGVLG